MIAAARNERQLALKLFEESCAVAAEQQDKQLETMAVTAVGLLLICSKHKVAEQRRGWQTLQR